jgi:c-di-GMP-binding flagellar brake protein YcgR
LIPIPGILLQQGQPFLSPANRGTTYQFVLISGIVIVVLVLGGVIASSRRRRLDPESRRRFSRSQFQKTARNIGLSKIHTEYLEYLARVCRVQQPFLLFSNPGLLDDVLRKGIYSLQQNAALKPEDRERRMGLLFQIKQTIERNARRAAGIKSTSYLKVGQTLTLSLERGGQFPCRVMSNMRELLAVTVPSGASGGRARWPRGTRVRLSFWREGDAGYAFDSKIVGYDTIKGTPCILIQHSKSLRRAQKRRFRRSALNRPCFFYPVQIVEDRSGRTPARKAMVQASRRLLGHLLDISAGGCSISSLTPLPAGSLCKVEFEIRRQNRIVVFGKVMRLRGQQSERGGVMHLMFTSVSSQHLNQIYSFVYDYAPPAGFPQPAAPRQPR